MHKFLFICLVKSLSDKARVLGTPADNQEIRARLYKYSFIHIQIKRFFLEMKMNDVFMTLQQRQKLY